jgi:hypothetical protein
LEPEPIPPNSLPFSFLKREEGRVRESGSRRKRRDRKVSEREKGKWKDKDGRERKENGKIRTEGREESFDKPSLNLSKDQ